MVSVLCAIPTGDNLVFLLKFRCMYQHIVLDEIPNSTENTKQYEKEAYQYNTDYIDYDLYEDISTAMSFFNEIERSQSDAFIDKHEATRKSSRVNERGIPPVG